MPYAKTQGGAAAPGRPSLYPPLDLQLILPAESATEATDVIYPTDAQGVRHQEGLRTVVAGELLWMGATECRPPVAYIRGAFGPLFGVLLVPCLGVPVGVLSETGLALRCRLRLSGLEETLDVLGETGLALRCRLRLSGLGETLGVLGETDLALRCRLRLSGLGETLDVLGETGLALRCRLRLSGLGETLGVLGEMGLALRCRLDLPICRRPCLLSLQSPSPRSGRLVDTCCDLTERWCLRRSGLGAVQRSAAVAAAGRCWL